jgi:hypothetical protein
VDRSSTPESSDVGLELIGPADDRCDLAYVDGEDNDNGLLDGADSAAVETWIYPGSSSICDSRSSTSTLHSSRPSTRRST